MLIFLYELGDNSFYLSNWLFGMFHSGTSDHNKDVIIKSMCDPKGIVKVVFATIALGMGVNLASLNKVIHYGAPRSLDDYFQEYGRTGRSGEHAYSIIYWFSPDAPRYKDTSDHYKQETVLVRDYLENTETCRKTQLLKYFVGEVSGDTSVPHAHLCCDVCNAKNCAQNA